MSETPRLLATETASPDVHAAVEQGAAIHIEPMAFGLAPYQWVAVAMALFILILVWKGVPRLIARGLDGRIAAIREQLDEAKKLRAEAEALRAEYATKIANAEKDAAAMLDHARQEAALIVDQAAADTAAVIARRERMAQDKIAAAERRAVEELRTQAAEVATMAASRLIAARHDAPADRRMVDEAIATL